MPVLTRANSFVRRHGVAGAARTIYERVSPVTAWSMELVWYALRLDDPDRPRPELRPEFDLRPGAIADMPLLAQLPVDPQVVELSSAVVRERLDNGARLWLVTEGDRTAFSCWNFYGAAPIRARDDVVRLPPDVVVLEDSISSPRVRGRGVAPGAWCRIADWNRDQGRRFMVTKVAVENTASRKAVERAGFREVARLHLSGPVWRMRIRVDLREPGGPFDWMSAVEQH